MREEKTRWNLVAGQSRLRRGKPGGGHAESHMKFVRVRPFESGLLKPLSWIFEANKTTSITPAPKVPDEPKI